MKQLLFNTTELIDELAKSANAENAVAMKAYMKNQFSFFGIKTPERRQILKEYIKGRVIINKTELNGIIKELWTQPERELQYCAIEILIAYKKLWTEDTIELIEYCLTNKSWWDTVDPLACDCAGTYFKINPSTIIDITDKWNRNENKWLQRSSLLFQKSYKNETDRNLLAKYILHLASSTDFFIQKAIGWILREYARTNPDWVRKFVSETKLATLSQREALKHL